MLSFRLQELENEREPLQLNVVELKEELTEAQSPTSHGLHRARSLSALALAAWFVRRRWRYSARDTRR